MKTAFVIPHMGRSELLLQTLESIAGQDGCNGQIEVIVVTKETGLNLAEKLVSSTGDIPVFVLSVGADLTIAAQRNLGARHSTSEHLAFIDADIALASDWLETMQKLLCEDPSRAIVSAVQQYSSTPTALEIIRTDQANASTDVNLQHMPGSNLFMRRVHFESVDGFPEHLVTCEDYYFTGKVAALGKLYNSSRSSYVHLGEDKYLAPMFVKEIWRGASNLQSIAGRSVGFSELPSFLVPLWVLLAVLASTISLMLGSGTGLSASLLSVVVPVVLYSLRLKWRSQSSASMLDTTTFYFVYFAARGLGMCMGLAKFSRGSVSRLIGSRQ